MTETVTLALQGRAVQLGHDSYRPAFLTLLNGRLDDAQCRLTQPSGTGWCVIDLDIQGTADLRDILNALARQ